MDVGAPARHTDSQIDRYPLLMEQVESNSGHQHIIDVERNGDTSSTSSHDDQLLRVDSTEDEDELSPSVPAPADQTTVNSLNRLNSMNSSSTRRGDGYHQHRRSPLNSGLWISVELVVTVGQIIASIVVLSLSRHENPEAPLFAWVVGYASGCVATLPILYWRYCSRNRGSDWESNQSHRRTSHTSHLEPRSYTAISVTQSTDEGNQHSEDAASWNGQVADTLSSR